MDRFLPSSVMSADLGRQLLAEFEFLLDTPRGAR
jgi:hypothetical protein